MKKQIILSITVEDIREADFNSNCNCAIARAYRRQEKPNAPILEGIDLLTISTDEGEYVYRHSYYGSEVFAYDSRKAFKHRDDPDFIIRDLVLTLKD